MAPPPDSIDKAYQIMKASYIDTLTNNAADALIAGEVRASNLLRIPLNFNLINSRAVSATLDYRQTLERFGGSDVTEIGEDGVARRVFKPWLNDMIQSDKERVGQIIQDAVKQGTLPEKALEDVFTAREHDAALTAYQETKALYNKGTFDRFSHESVQQATWKHMDPQPDPREEHQALDGQVFDLDDPIWAELDLPNCHCRAIPVLPVGGPE
jgi:SPP1 gp7 family putative phage head morphogenesis protein